MPTDSWPKYLFKLKLTKNVKRAIHRIDWPDWKEGQPNGMEQIAEIKLKLTG